MSGSKPPSKSKPSKPKKSPAVKRAEKAAEREEWSDGDIADAFAAAGGIPKESKPKHAGGRPPIFPTLDMDLMRRLYEAGNTDTQVAQVMGVSLSAITLWKREKPE